MLTNTNSTKLGKVLGNFDFVKIQALMLDLEWGWGENDEVPSISEMVDMAHSLLVKACNNTGFCASGGFEATFNNSVFTLKFVTEESSNEDDTPYYEITADNHNKALHAINNMKNYPVEITADLNCNSKLLGTIYGEALETLDGIDIHEMMQRKYEELGDKYMSQSALEDIYAWTAMQSPRKTEQEFWDSAIDDLEKVRLDIIADTRKEVPMPEGAEEKEIL